MIKRLGRLLVIPGVLLGTTLVTPGATSAQAKFEVTPLLGSFYPLTKMCTDCNNDGSDLRGRLVNSAAFGGRLTYWISSTLGLEAFGGYTPSRIEVSTSDTTGFSFGASAKGTILLASGRLLYRPARTNLHFIVGGGIVRRGGDVWKLAKDSADAKLTSPAAILGIGVRAAVTPKFALIITAEGNFYSFDPKLGPFSDPGNGSKLQTDILVSIGVPIGLSH
jgi:hypothetical protein